MVWAISTKKATLKTNEYLIDCRIRFLLAHGANRWYWDAPNTARWNEAGRPVVLTLCKQTQEETLRVLD